MYLINIPQTKKNILPLQKTDSEFLMVIKERDGSENQSPMIQKP